MKIFKSIKWRLQLWYGLILVTVLVGFGATAYQLERNRQFRRVDDEIHKRIGALARQLHRPPRGPQQARPNPDALPEEGQPEGGDGPMPQFPEDAPPNRVRRPIVFNLIPQVAALFDTNQTDKFYFTIKSRDGKEIARAGDVPTHLVTDVVDNALQKANYNRGQEALWQKKSLIWTENGFREIFETLPSGETIMVGCPILPELKELRRTAFSLTAVGGSILLVGLIGGWWFVRRALRPIAEIGSTAAKISTGDLSQRVNVAETESELGQLAAVLNSTFARLESAFAQQKQFASDAAHELRTPVSVILTQTQMALNRERDAESYKQTVEACQRAAQRMRRLIESLLELARFDAGQEILKRLRFDYAKTIAESIELVKALVEEKQVKILPELEPLVITGDSERLAQVVLNLLTNAIQYNKPGGEVRVKLEARNGLAILEISDTGQGIMSEDLLRVFERFYRADKSRTGNGNSGLGLSICKAIVEAHGGTIEVASQVDAGTTFTVRLPV